MVEFLFEERVIPWKEAFVLYRHILSNAAWFSTGSELLVLSRLLERTLGWRKLEEKVWHAAIRTGALVFDWGHSGLTHRGMTKALKSIRDRRLIFSENKRFPHGWQLRFRLNALGMAEALCDSFGKEGGGRIASMEKMRLDRTVGLLTGIWNERGWETVPVRLKSIVSETRFRLDEKKVRQKYLSGFIGTQYEDMQKRPYTEVWTQKLTGQGKNYVKECDSLGIDVKAELLAAMANWHEYRTELRTDEGRELELEFTFNFKQFYTFRRQVRAWLVFKAETRGTEPKYRVRLVEGS